jgi:hypothetical protein
MTEEHPEIRKDLEEKLKVIDWSLEPCGCHHYRILNNRKRRTVFLYNDGRIETESISDIHPFGQKGGGIICINLKRCTVEILNAARPFVSIVAATDNAEKPALFISFYKIED